MQLRSFSSRIWPLAALLLTLGTTLYSVRTASATELVVNGDFETGDLTGWTFGNGIFVQPTVGVGGTFGEGNEASSTFDPTLSQTLTTTAGASYTLSFDYRPTNTTNPINKLSVLWDGMEVYSSLNSVGFFYAHHTFNVVATGTSTELDFTGYNNPGTSYLDNISVLTANATTVPEGNTFALLGLALPLIGAVIARRRK